MWWNSRKFLSKRIIPAILLIITIQIPFIYLWTNEHLMASENSKAEMLPKTKDWHDWRAFYIDFQRESIGEQGKRATLGNNTDSALEEKLYRQHGLNALLSDAISFNRSIRDVRDKRCAERKYLEQLPTVSIVIPFHNELFSTFARTLHSLTNRTPPELLKEIILVDDFSDPDFFAKLKKYATEHFEKVQFLRMPKRVGLIQARLAGARKMTAEVLVIFDAHIEVTHNWLPPLLEPIALNRRAVTCPLIDVINDKSLEYIPITPYRGGFNWHLTYQQMYFSAKEKLQYGAEPYGNPVMAGGLFAISLDYFWELGGYDEGLEIWGGEQYELSFKVWMCGGEILNVPCSRVGHHFRGNLNKGMDSNNTVYLKRNLKRVADVWMDEYAKYVYERWGGAFEKVDAGDLTQQKALRTKLHCKPFSWFMDNIASDILKNYPLFTPLEYAIGAIQSVAAPHLCIDTFGSNTPGLYPCHANLKNPSSSQMFALKWSRDIRHDSSQDCFDVPKYYENATLILYPCHEEGGTQFWYYDRRNKLLKHGPKGTYCLEAVPSEKKLFMNVCRIENPNMKWNFGAINETALDNFYENKTTQNVMLKNSVTY